MSGIPKIDAYSISESSFPNLVNWKVEPQRAVVLFHDMQHYFLRPFSADSNPALSLIKNVKRLRDVCKEIGLPVAYTAQPGNMSPQQRGLLKDFWGEGMTANLEDRQVIPSIAPAPEDWVLTKWRYSAFAKTDLLERLRNAGRDQLVICGVYCHVGILATALDAYSNDIQPFVIADATGDFSQAEHTMALDYISRRCGVVATTESVLDNLGAMP